MLANQIPYEALSKGKPPFLLAGRITDLIRARAPVLNLGITKLLKIGGRPPVNIANYWHFAVVKNPLRRICWSLLYVSVQSRSAN